jgi:hypothetical protein
MHDLKVWHVTGWFGLVGFFLFVSQVPLYLIGSPVPPINDAIAHTQHLANIRVIVLTRVLLDMGLYVCLMVFFAGFRHLILKARPAYETLVHIYTIVHAHQNTLTMQDFLITGRSHFIPPAKRISSENGSMLRLLC